MIGAPRWGNKLLWGYDTKQAWPGLATVWSQVC